jgi:mono/diheme cytochrome c family protein
LTAASLWIGGLGLLLSVLVPTLRELTPDGRRVVLVRAVPRFSVVALTSWGVLGLTGLYSAWLQVGNLDGLRNTAYGHSLSAKLLLLVPLLGLGAFNLLVASPELRRARGNPAAALAWSRHVTLAVAAEVLLALVVLLVVGRLTGQAPARETIAGEAGHAVLAFAGDGRSATLSITPAATGPNHYRLDVAGATLPEGTEALLRLTLAGNGIGEKEVTLLRAVGDAFEGHGSELSIAGDWQVEVIVRKIGAFEWHATKVLSVGTQPPTVRLPRPAWHFDPGGVGALALLVLGIASLVVAWAAGHGRLRVRSGALGTTALGVAAALVLAVRTNAPAATGQTASTTESAAAQLDAGAVARGQTVFLANCAACHGTKGKGDGPAAAGLNPPPVDFTSPLHRQHKTDDLILWVTQGIPGSAMPAFGGTLSDAEIRDVVTYVQSLSFASAARAAANPTTTATADVPAPEDCQVEPRSITAILAEAATPVAPADDATPFDWPRGDPATDADVGRITRTLRAFVACGNAGDYGRRLAFYSDRYLREFYGGLSAADRQSALDTAATPAAALPADQRAWIDTVEDVSTLPDGRIGAHVVVEDPVQHPHLQSFVVVFVQQGGRWLIDELHPDAAGTTPPATPESIPAVGPGTPVTSGGLIATLQQDAFVHGLNVLTFRFVDPRGQPVTGLNVTVSAVSVDGEAGSVSARALETNSGRYVADLAFGATGDWSIDAVVTRNGQQTTYTFEVTVT